MIRVVTPDGRRYLSMALGQREPNPYHLRWAMPLACRTSLAAWTASSWSAIAACAALTAWLGLQHGLTSHEAFVAAALWLGLPSTRFFFVAPVLVDAMGLALALAAACLWPEWSWAAVALSVASGAVWEKAPVWAAVFGWSPWLLAGLAVPALRYLLFETVRPTTEDRELAIRESRIVTGLQDRISVLRDPFSVLFPWGACAAALFAPGPWWLAALALGMAQLLVAYDTVRLIQHSAPAVCVAAASVIPVEYALPILVAHWLNPWAGRGI